MEEKEMWINEKLNTVYEKIGEEGFGDIAEWLLRLLCITPLIAGIINYVMLLDIPSYDPYLFNARCIILSDVGFGLISLCFILYVLCKMSYLRMNIKNVILTIKDRETWLLLWIALLFWGIITCFASVSFKYAFLGATNLHAGYITHVFMICVMGCSYMLSDEGRKRVINVYVIVSDILVFIMLSFNYNIPFFNSFSGYAGVATFTNSNHYGYYLAMVIPCLAGLFYISYEKTEQGHEDQKLPCIAYLISFIIHMQGMMINDCMGAFIGVFFALIILMTFWVIRRRCVKLVYLLPSVIMIVMIYLSYVGIITSVLGSTIGTSLPRLFKDIFSVAQKSEGYEAAGTNRIFLWKETIAAISRRPVFGYGPDILYGHDLKPCVSMTPHNEFLECALYMGIPGLILYLGGLILLFINRIKRLRDLPDHVIVAAASVIGYQISAFFGVRMFHIVPYLFMFLGMIITKGEKKDSEDEKA